MHCAGPIAKTPRRTGAATNGRTWIQQRSCVRRARFPELVLRECVRSLPAGIQRSRVGLLLAGEGECPARRVFARLGCQPDSRSPSRSACAAARA